MSSDDRGLTVTTHTGIQYFGASSLSCNTQLSKGNSKEHVLEI